MTNPAEASDPETVIRAHDLTKVFRDFWRRPIVCAVDRIALNVRRGEIFGLLGPNGSGKSTTMKMLLGLLFPTGGKLTVFSAKPRSVRVKARIGYLPEESWLYPNLTVAEILHLFGRLFQMDSRERQRRVDELLEMVGLAHARHRLAGELSKGMARRIGLAQALINDPELLVLDEPTSGLDPLGCRQMKDLILALGRRGKTILLTSHLLADVEDVCHRVAILYNGSIRAEGTLKDLLEERRVWRFTVPDCPTDVMERITAAIRATAGRDPAIDHPQIPLEQFFVRVVEQARGAIAEQSGVAAEGRLAAFLENPR